jgi:hypothetical protein
VQIYPPSANTADIFNYIQGKGIINGTNNCYVIVILQSFFRIRNFIDQLFAQTNQASIILGNTIWENFDAKRQTMDFSYFYDNYNDYETGKNPRVPPDEIPNKIRSLYGYPEGDPSQFLNNLYKNILSSGLKNLISDFPLSTLAVLGPVLRISQKYNSTNVGKIITDEAITTGIRYGEILFVRPSFSDDNDSLIRIGSINVFDGFTLEPRLNIRAVTYILNSLICSTPGHFINVGVEMGISNDIIYNDATVSHVVSKNVFDTSNGLKFHYTYKNSLGNDVKPIPYMLVYTKK